MLVGHDDRTDAEGQAVLHSQAIKGEDRLDRALCRPVGRVLGEGLGSCAHRLDFIPGCLEALARLNEKTHRHLEAIQIAGALQRHCRGDGPDAEALRPGGGSEAVGHGGKKG